MERFCKPVITILVFAFLLCLLPSVALAGPAPADNLQAFLNADCEQFEIGTDSNSYTHSYSDFPNAYKISNKYLQQLLDIEPSGLSQLSVLSLARGEWIGSCFGIAATMVLNQMTQNATIQAGSELYIDHFQSDALKYYDLYSPINNLPVLDMINYYLLSQAMPSVKALKNSVTLASLTPEEQQQNNEKLDAYIDQITATIDADKPFLFTFAYEAGGHAIVGCDYWEDDNGTPADAADDTFYLKVFDENVVRPNGALEDQHYAYLQVQKNDAGEYSATPNTVRLYYYKDAGGYAPHSDLAQIAWYDMEVANQFLNIHNPSLAPVVAQNTPQLLVEDIVQTHQKIQIIPVGEQGEVGLDDSIGFVLQQPLTIPLPVSLAGSYPAPSLEDYNYQTSSEDRLDIVLTLKERGYTGYNVKVASDTVANFTMAKENESGESAFAKVASNGLAVASFDRDSNLTALRSHEDTNATNLDLVLGTLNADVALDMFQLGLPQFSYLEVYGEQDDPSFADSVVLHSDGFPQGLGFKFFRGTLESETIYGETDLEDTWLKIRSRALNDSIVVSVWSSTEVESGFPVFDGDPDWSSELEERPDDPTFVPVTEVQLQTQDAVAGEETALLANILPEDATNRQIQWSISIEDDGSTGASIRGYDQFTATHPGVATLTATVANGLDTGVDYVQDFQVKVAAAPVELTGTVINCNTAVNVRSGPSSVFFPVLGTAPKGTTYIVLDDQPRNGYYAIDYHGQTGYIHQSYFALNHPAPEPVGQGSVVNCNKAVNVRSGPFGSYPILGAAPLNAVYDVYDLLPSNNYYEIDFNGQVGYIHKNYFVINGQPGPVIPCAQIVNCNVAVNVRSGPSSAFFPVIGAAPKNATYTLLSSTPVNNYYAIDFGGITGYVHANYVAVLYV